MTSPVPSPVLPGAPTQWTPPFLSLKVHAAIEHQLRLGLKNVESTLIVGPRGAGKSATIARLLERLRGDELRAQLAGGPQAREILDYETSRANGAKTILSDIYLKLIKRPMSRRSKQDWSPTIYIDQITAKVVEDNIALICIDEAQLIDPSNIELLRQLPDAAAKKGHALRLVLVGNNELMKNVHETGQLGERFTGYVQVSAFSPGEVSPYLAGFHPGLGALQQALPAKQWKSLERAIFDAACGSFRRLITIIGNAHALAEAQSQAMTEQHVHLAIGKLPGLN